MEAILLVKDKPGDVALVRFALAEHGIHCELVVIRYTPFQFDTVGLQGAHKRNQVRLLVGLETEFQNDVEELHRILQRQQPAVVHIGW
jgi:hypothetical protein